MAKKRVFGCLTASCQSSSIRGMGQLAAKAFRGAGNTGFPLLPFAAGVLLVGCAVTPPASQMATVAAMAPDSWSATAAGKMGVDRQWVRSFGDAQLEELVREALRRNADMRVAQQRVEQSRKLASIAGAGARPSLALSLDSDRSKRQMFGEPFTGSQQLNSHYANMAVSWEPDLWGRVRAGQSAAIADAQAAELDQRAVASLLAADVCKAWFALGEANEQLKYAKKVVEFRQQSAAMIADRFEQNLANDGGSASQLRLSQSEIAVGKANIAQREAEVELARRRLEVLCGRYPSGKVQGGERLSPMPKKTPAGLPSDLLMRRPDVVAAERRYAAAVARVKEAKKAVFPLLKLTGSGGSASDVLENLVDGNFSAWSIGAGITQNILTGGRVLGEKQIRDSKEIEELAKLEGVVLKAFGEVESALVLEELLARRVESMEQAHTLAEDAVAAAREDYLVGAGDSLTLLTAQSSAAEVGAQLVALKRVRLENRVDLHLALGGNFKLEKK